MLTQTKIEPKQPLQERKTKADILVLIPGDGINKKNMIRDLVYGCWCNGRRIGGMQMPPVNHLYVATILNEDGHNVRFIDGQIDYDSFNGLRKKGFKNLDFVFFLSSTGTFKDDIACARQVKSANPKTKTVFFGSHPTFLPESTLNEEVVDYIIIREPEMTIKNLVRRLMNNESLNNLAGCGFKKDGKLIINPFDGHFDMNALPVPDWTMLPQGIDYFNPVVKRMPFATMQTSRGCPAKCIYCTSPFFYGNDIRVKTAENVLKEIRYLVGLGYREIFFRDETFTAYKKRNMEICQAIIDEKIDITWIANGRVDMIDRESAEMMKKAGCHMIKFGVESGDDQMLVNLKKGASVAQAKEAFKICRESGLDTHSHIIFGGPGETLESIKNTIDLVIEIESTTASFGILTPYPGTEHFKMVQEKFPEIMDGTEADMERLHTTPYYSQALTNIEPGQLQGSIGKAYRTFYFRLSYLWKWLKRIDSMEEFFRLAIAGSNIFTFGLTSQK